MTNREAIKMLKTILRTVCLGNQYFNEAIDLAISALEFKERYDQFWEEVKSAERRD